jgi:hypothetical protein
MKSIDLALVKLDADGKSEYRTDNVVRRLSNLTPTEGERVKRDETPAGHKWICVGFVND